ncbi:MAG: thiamine pyrophosphate-requiring protein [Chloroflexota bacterium]|nr:MAG: thiamine pyrophosphate-requiring protein [Chloroflexota bacterium]
MNGFDAVVSILKREGVEYLFSYPNNAIIDSAAKAGLRPVIARGEKTLINMADGYARSVNGKKPAVIVVQQGSGIENCFGAIAQAYADSIPLLIIPGGGDQRNRGSEFDPIPSFGRITKWADRVTYPERLASSLRRAFQQLRNPPYGPVLLEIPRDVGAAEIPDATLAAYVPARAYRSAADSADVTKAIDILSRAKRPMIIAGHGVLWAEAWGSLRAFAESTGIPVMTTMASKGVFAENHPLSLGVGGLTLSRAAAQFLTTSDVILALGAGLIATVPFVTPIPEGKTLIQVSHDHDAIDRDYTIQHALIGDVGLVIDQLQTESAKKGLRGPDATGEIREARAAELRQWSPRFTSDETPISPYRVIRDLMNTVDRANTVVTHDSGNPRDQTLTSYEAITPRGYLGWGKSTQLGTGMGIALGAKLATPDKLCVNILGDLAFGTIGMEVETAVRERLPILTVLINNSVMGGYGHHMPNASEKFSSNRLSGEYWKVAEGLGAYAERVTSPSEVVPALKRAIDATRRGRPATIEFITREEPVYPVARGLLAEVAKELRQPV